MEKQKTAAELFVESGGSVTNIYELEQSLSQGENDIYEGKLKRDNVFYLLIYGISLVCMVVCFGILVISLNILEAMFIYESRGLIVALQSLLLFVCWFSSYRHYRSDVRAMLAILKKRKLGCQ